MTSQEVVKKLKSLAHGDLASMARFGVDTSTALGVTIPHLRSFARDIGKDHKLALELWKTGIHEARILASMVDDPEQVTEKQMDAWVKDFNSWDVCDQTCSNLFRYTSFALQKCKQWAGNEEEFVKRTGFALMASLAAAGKNTVTDQQFKSFLPLIIREATDERNFVRKAVNWALRQIGKRNEKLHADALKTALEIEKIDSKSARWIAKDAIRELKSDGIAKRLRSKGSSRGKK